MTKSQGVEEIAEQKKPGESSFEKNASGAKKNVAYTPSAQRAKRGGEGEQRKRERARGEALI